MIFKALLLFFWVALFPCIMLTAVPSHAKSLPPSSVPSIPATGENVQDFVPPGWTILFQAEGDLNQDSLSDAALILSNGKKTEEKNGSGEIPRVLALLFQQAAGGYRLSISSERPVLCGNCGGVSGDPVQGMKIERGTVVINHYGGSQHRWGFTHRYRFQNGAWVLIGKTTFTENNITSASDQKDMNLLTGQVIEETKSPQGKKTVKRYRVPVPPLKKLNEVDLTET